MARKLAIFMLLITSTVGRPLEEDREAKYRQFQSSSSSSSVSVFSGPGQVQHQSASVMVSSNSNGNVTHSEFHSASGGTGSNQGSFILTSSSIDGQKPQTILITQNPATGEVIKKEFAAFFGNLKSGINSDNDFVQSDFSASNITGFPEEGDSDFSVSSLEQGQILVAGEEPANSNKSETSGNVLDKIIEENLVTSTTKPVGVVSSSSISSENIASNDIRAPEQVTAATEQKPIVNMASGSLVPSETTSGTAHHQSVSNNANANDVGGFVAISSSSVTEEEPVTTVTVGNPLAGNIAQSVSASSAKPSAGETSQRIFQGSGEVNKQTAESQHSGAESSANSQNSDSINGENPVTVVTATNPSTREIMKTTIVSSSPGATQYQPSGANLSPSLSGGAILTSSSSNNGGKSLMVVTATNPLTGEGSVYTANNQLSKTTTTTGGATQTQHQASAANLATNSSGGTISVYTSSKNGGKPIPEIKPSKFAEPAKVASNHVIGQHSGGAIGVSSVSINAQPVKAAATTKNRVTISTSSIITASSPSTEEIQQSKFEGSGNLSNDPISADQASQGSTVVSRVFVNSQPAKTRNPSAEVAQTSNLSESAIMCNGSVKAKEKLSLVRVQASTKFSAQEVTQSYEGSIMSTETTLDKQGGGSKPSASVINSSPLVAQMLHQAIPISASSVTEYHSHTVITSRDPSSGAVVQTTYVKPQGSVAASGFLGGHLPYPSEDSDPFHSDLSTLMDCDYPFLDDELHHIHISESRSMSHRAQLENRFSSTSGDEDKVQSETTNGFNNSGVRSNDFDTFTNDFDKENPSQQGSSTVRDPESVSS